MVPSLSDAIKSEYAADPRADGYAIEEPFFEKGYVFARWILYPMRRALFENNNERRIGSRAAAILTALVERAGDVVSKDELIKAAWPTTFVEDDNLKVQIATLRKILGDDPDRPRFITNIIGIGYRFIEPVEPVNIRQWPPGDDDLIVSSKPAKGLPAPVARLIGRRDDVMGIVRLVEAHRLVTIVGAGGIGKTATALAAGQEIASIIPHPMIFVDLAAVAHGFLVPFAIAAALGMSAESDDPTASLIRYLQDRKAFLLIDNCEHVIDDAATLCEALLRAVPGLHILATSREPLQAEGERPYRLTPLAFPHDDHMNLKEALHYPSVELFVERAASNDRGLPLTNDDVPFIVAICQKLDGLPLAIEIAAARVEVFGIVDLAERLESCLDVPGRRTAVDRHQTMRRVLDWSYENLAHSERTLLRRLAIFAGQFTFEAATMIAGDEYLSASTIAESISSLVRKSLLNPSHGAGPMTYRLLESTRIYAGEKLSDVGESQRMRQLHIQFAIDIMQRAEDDWTVTPRAVWIERYATMMDDIRQALQWAFSSGGDAAAGIRLSALVMPLGMQMGLVDEFRQRNDMAIAIAAKLDPPELVAEMKLNMFHGFLNANQGEPQDITIAGVARAVHLAEMTGEDRYRIQPRVLMAGFRFGMGSYCEALRYAEEAALLAEGLYNDLATLGTQRILTQATHFNGLHSRSTELARRVLASPVVNIPLAFGGVQIDKRISMRIMLSRSLWLQGHAQQALGVMREALAIAPEAGAAAFCQTLSQAACPILLWRGEIEEVHEHVIRLLAEASRFTLSHWHSWGRMYERILQNIYSNPTKRLTSIQTEGVLQTHTLATFTGQTSGIDFADPALEATCGWAAPEIFRRRGADLLKTDAGKGEEWLTRSIALAKQQEALAWELRAVTSLARHWHARGDTRRAVDELSAVYDRFDEGFETADLKSAAGLLSLLRTA